VKVRITQKPRERDLDGMRLDALIAGMVREVSPLVGAWLVTQGYAVPEMRRTREEDLPFSRFTSPRRAGPRPRRRRVAH
jgi:hypothetical protein